MQDFKTNPPTKFQLMQLLFGSGSPLFQYDGVVYVLSGLQREDIGGSKFIITATGYREKMINIRTID